MLGVNTILEIRSNGEFEVQRVDASMGVRKTSDIKLDALYLIELLDYQEEQHEPPLTFHLATSEVKQIISMLQWRHWTGHAMPYTEHWEGYEMVTDPSLLGDLSHTQIEKMVFVEKGLVGDLWLKIKQNPIC